MKSKRRELESHFLEEARDEHLECREEVVSPQCIGRVFSVTWKHQNVDHLPKSSTKYSERTAGPRGA